MERVFDEKIWVYRFFVRKKRIALLVSSGAVSPVPTPSAEGRTIWMKWIKNTIDSKLTYKTEKTKNEYTTF